MISFIKEEIPFVLLMFSWVFVGMYMGPVIYVYLPLTIILLKAQNQIGYLLYGFFLVLVLSDNRHDAMIWAGRLKEVYIIFLSLFLFLDKKSFSNSTNFLQNFIPFFLVTILCNLNSDVIFVSFQKTLSYFLLIAIIPSYVIKLYREDAMRFFRSMMGTIGLILFLGLLINLFTKDVVTYVDRFCGLLGNPNGLGIFCMMIFFLFGTIINLHPECFTRREYYVYIGLILVSIFLSGARSSILGIGIFIFFNFFHRISIVLGFIVFILIAISYQIIESNFAVIVHALNLDKFIRAESINNASGRIIAWNFAWQEIQKNFFWGKGFSYAYYLFGENYNKLSRMGHQGNAHNSYLTIWLETGLVGLVLYLFGWISTFFKSFKNTRVTIAIMYALLFQIFFESWLASSLNPYTIILIVILSISIAATKELSEEKKDTELETLPDFYPQRFVPH